jgi:outer membrane protein insertion porin family
LLFGIDGATFVDGGGTYLLNRGDGSNVHNAAVTWENFRRSVGLGLRYDTPVGPLALDYGFKLDRRSHESIGKLHFSIGTIF